MAEHGAAEIGTATGTDYADHLRTYEGFVQLSKWGSIFVVIVLILMAFFLL
ncbi:aa3-type cytochrome c oxidase subunit IV [Bauldia litoralis]|uniref:Aa3 type cytochrome c oxidase subunit IV n=1 Tax=Bauldia litoralis TaxID=665467 RepID=A0A1G6A3U7_9HYPH|nr:aa3-type cytochrome c oxidase subunit IV [Bauldia litoralis]SDB03010.1 aa3 type cytochrome c oxidase subunit IV [Bauldia litoralis]